MTILSNVCCMIKGGRHMKYKKIAIVALVFVLIVLFTFPYAVNFLLPPEFGCELRDTEKKLVLIGAIIREYKHQHGGHIPSSMLELQSFALKKPKYAPTVHEFMGNCSIEYFPKAHGNRPVAICSLVNTKGKSVMLWVDMQGAVHMALIWLWPTWNLSKYQ